MLQYRARPNSLINIIVWTRFQAFCCWKIQSLKKIFGFLIHSNPNVSVWSSFRVRQIMGVRAEAAVSTVAKSIVSGRDPLCHGPPLTVRYQVVWTTPTVEPDPLPNGQDRSERFRIAKNSSEYFRVA